MHWDIFIGVYQDAVPIHPICTCIIRDRKKIRPFTPERFSPEDVRPYPKAGARKKTSKKKSKTLILTDTHVKQ